MALDTLPVNKVDSILRKYSFVFVKSSVDTLFYGFVCTNPNPNEKIKDYYVFKTKDSMGCKGDSLFLKSYVKGLALINTDEFDDRIFWHYFNNNYYLSLRLYKTSNSYILRIKKI
jgi:hypothetical protein